MKYASHVLLMDSLTLSRRTKCPFLNNGRVFLDTNPISPELSAMYLIYFSNTYLNFRLPELDSLLDLFGYDKDRVYDK